MAGVADWTLHDLRRTFRTALSRLKVAGVVAELSINHQLKGVEGNYDIYDFWEEKRAAWNRFGGLLGRIIAGDSAAVESYVKQFRPDEPAVIASNESNVVALKRGA